MALCARSSVWVRGDAGLGQGGAEPDPGAYGQAEVAHRAGPRQPQPRHVLSFSIEIILNGQEVLN